MITNRQKLNLFAIAAGIVIVAIALRKAAKVGQLLNPLSEENIVNRVTSGTVQAVTGGKVESIGDAIFQIGQFFGFNTLSDEFKKDVAGLDPNLPVLPPNTG